MTGFALEELTPRVVSTGHKRVIMPKPTTTTLVPYRGCFVRYKYRNGSTPVLDTVLLQDTSAWSYYELSGSDYFNNRPFGILDNNPAEADSAKDATAGKWAIIVFDTEDAPIRVAFRLTNDNYTLEPAKKEMLGRRFNIYGVQAITREGTFVLPFAVLNMSNIGLICRQVYPAVYADDTSVKEYGWVVLDLPIAKQATNPAEEDAVKFLSFPYVYPLFGS